MDVGNALAAVDIGGCDALLDVSDASAAAGTELPMAMDIALVDEVSHGMADTEEGLAEFCGKLAAADEKWAAGGDASHLVLEFASKSKALGGGKAACSGEGKVRGHGAWQSTHSQS